MNEEELFCKLFPEYAVNGKPLSPYFDLFENGYEQAEKRIAELEDKLTEKVTFESLDVVSGKIAELEGQVTRAFEVLADKRKRIEELEKENAELRKNGICVLCSKLAKLEREKKELQDKLKNLASVAEVRLANWQKYEKENAELKAFKEKCRFNVSDIFKEIETENNLTKAKEIIKGLKAHLDLSDCVNNDYRLQLLKQAEQFLRDSDIDGAIKQANEGLDFDKIADEMEQDLKDSEVEK